MAAKANNKKRAEYATGTLGANNGKRADTGAGSFRYTTSGKVEYRFGYIDEYGKSQRKSFTCDDMNECIAKAEAFKKRMELLGQDVNPDESIGKILRRVYRKDYEMGFSKEQGYCRNLANLAILDKSNLTKVPIRDITKGDVSKYLGSLSGYSETMVKKIYAQIKLAFSVALMDGLIEENFMEHRDMKCPKIGKPAKKVSGLTIEQQKKFVEALERTEPPHGRNDYRLQLMIELYSGMRMGEINALRESDIDFENNVIHVRRTISRGFEYREFLNETTKTEAGNRDVPISNKLRPYLEQALEKQKPNKDNLIFYDYGKNSFVTTSQVNCYYKRMCRKLGIPADGQHALRHTFATRCIESGIPAIVLKSWLGHTNIHITLDTYTDVFDSMNNKAVENFDQYIDMM